MGEDTITVNELPTGLLHAIFNLLGPKDLCAASATCRRWRELNQDAPADKAWQAFFEQRWRPHLQMSDEGSSPSWQALYGGKMRSQRMFRGRPRLDTFFGHKGGVKCLGLVPSCNLMATGSTDRTVRLWDLTAGVQVAAKYQPCAVRALAVDASMLACSASKRGTLRVWRAANVDTAARFAMETFEDLHGHTGPVTSVAFNDECIFSGSWDYTVRVWSRSRLQALSVLPCSDWVWGVCPRGDKLLVAAGKMACVFDQVTLQPLRRYDSGSVRQMLYSPRVEGTRDGRLMFIGNADGALLAHDLRLSQQGPVRVLAQEGPPVQSIAFDDPWMAAALDDGSTLLLNIDAAMRSGRSGSAGGGSGRRGRDGTSAAAAAKGVGDGRWAVPGPAVKRHFVGGASGPAFCVDISDQWMACGTDTGVVRTWDFSEAEEVQEQLRMAREARQARRRQRAPGFVRCKAPRFPPQPEGSDASDSDGGEAQAGCEEANADINSCPHNPPMGARASASAGSEDLESGGLELGAPGNRSCPELGCPGTRRSNRSLGCQPPRTPSAGVPPPPPPPVLRSVGWERQEYSTCRMTSWDISRPRAVLEKERRGGEEGVKVAG